MRVLRVGICGLIAFAVLAHGAVEPWSEAVLEIGAAILFLMWAVRAATGRITELHWNPLGWPLAGFVGLLSLQYFAGLTLYSYLTKEELLLAVAYLLLFFLTAQAFRTEQHWRGLLWFLIVLGFAVAVFAILQYLTFNGKLYWVRELRHGGSPFGPYVNRNHFAGLMELLIPMGLGLLALRGARRQQMPLLALLTILPVGALFLSASRGGIASFLAELGLLAFLVWPRGGKKEFLAAIVAVLVLAGALIAWLGMGRVISRFSTLEATEVSEARRLSMMRGTWHIFLDHPWVGTGAGTLISVYPRYETLYDGKVVNHTHNDFIELLGETGLAGGFCGLAFLVILIRRGPWRKGAGATPFAHAVRVGAIVACAGLLVHSLVDFNLHVPSNALLFLLLAGLAVTEPLSEARTVGPPGP